MDFFAESIVQRKKDTKDGLITTGIIILAIILTPIILSFTVLGSISLLIEVGMCYGAYILITSRNIEYEYAVTNGELDVDMIIARRKRKKVINVKAKEFEMIAPVGDEKFARDFNNTSIKKVVDASSNSNGSNSYFALIRKDGELIKLIFEPTEKMLSIFKTYKPQNVFMLQQKEEQA